MAMLMATNHFIYWTADNTTDSVRFVKTQQSLFTTTCLYTVYCSKWLHQASGSTYLIVNSEIKDISFVLIY